MSPKKQYQNVLIIGSTGRNVGKTTLLCQIIATVSKTQPVYAVKASVISPNRLVSEENTFQAGIFEETRKDTLKDTSRMLQAGARRVFYLQREQELLEGFLEILQELPPSCAIVCESNSLCHYLKSGLFLVVHPINKKLSTKERKRTIGADLLVHSDGHSDFADININFIEGKWQIIKAA